MSLITVANFSAANPLSTPMPQPAGSSECIELTSLTPGQKYYYALKTRDDCGNWSAMSNVISITQRLSGPEVTCGGGGGSPVSGAGVPRMVEYAIRGSNPSSGVTTLFVGVPTERGGETMDISIFDVTGTRIRTLVQRTAIPGESEITWDHRSEAGHSIPAGVYFARLRLGSETRTHKIITTVGR
jgi:hypothetical protein